MKKLHIGCGKNIIKNWINIDITSPCDLKVNVTTSQLPFNAGEISFIYTEHFIEHLTYFEGLNFLKECFRVLSKDGVIRLSTPNLCYIIDRYLAKDTTAWKSVHWMPQSPCKMVNEAFRNWEHKFVYDEHELYKSLSACGFHSPYNEKWRRSSFPPLTNIESRPFNQELIVEATKNV